jgi:hypothetical protein
MKTITVTEEFYNSALKCAAFVDGDKSTLADFEKHIAVGKNPEEHIAYHAAVVGGWTDSLDEMVIQKIS